MAFQIDPAVVTGQTIVEQVIERDEEVTHIHALAITETYGMVALCIMGSTAAGPAEAIWLCEPLSDMGIGELPHEGDFLD